MLYLLGFISYVLQLVLFVALHVKGSYSPLSHAVSDYGVGPTRSLFRLYGFAGFAGAVFVAVAILMDNRFPTRAGIYLIAMAVLRIGVLAFPTDLEGERLTWNGKLHYLFAIASFALIYMAIDALQASTGLLQLDSGVLPILTGLKWLITFSLIGVVVCMLPRLRKVFGAVERVFLGTTLFWLGLFAISAA